MSGDAPPAGFPVPLQLGDRIVGWVAADLAALAVGAATPSPDVTPARLLVVPQAAITYVTSLGGLVTVHADPGRYWTDLTLGEVERRLDPRRFLRLDASHLVNVTRLAELVPWTHQRYRLVFADAAKTELVMSRDVGRRLRAALPGGHRTGERCAAWPARRPWGFGTCALPRKSVDALSIHRV